MSILPAFKNAALLAVSLTISLFVGEVAARVFLNPADYLSVTLVSDEILVRKIAPGTRGFDEWGFRNKTVPRTSDIVAIGDSHTYGNNATMERSWPYVTGGLTGFSVYNMGVGGYGPNQYYHLLKTRALELKPRWVLCGLYLGDDFENAFAVTYGADYWSFLRQGMWSKVDADIWEATIAPTRFKRFRNWLSQNSVIYRISFHGPLLGSLKGALEILKASRQESPFVTTLTVPQSNIQEAFRPREIERNLDRDNPSIREGIRITFDLIEQMSKLSRDHGAHFAVVAIPTKEAVFADYLIGNPGLHLSEVIQRSVIHEHEIRKELFDFLDKHGIAYVDVLPPMRAEVSHQLYTRSDGDMHPSSNGYKVIGQAVADFLRHSQQRSRHSDQQTVTRGSLLSRMNRPGF